jgi:hypothetical protein
VVHSLLLVSTATILVPTDPSTRGEANPTLSRAVGRKSSGTGSHVAVAFQQYHSSRGDRAVFYTLAAAGTPAVPAKAAMFTGRNATDH